MKKKEKKVSIIIRTKNEEQWIEMCVRKIFEQTYKNIEIIIVNDGSSQKEYYNHNVKAEICH